MKSYFLNRQFLPIFMLIFLAGFLILPKICLAEDFEDISQEEMGQYLELSAKDAENLLWTLIQVFTTDWISREAAFYSTPEERLVPLVLRQAGRIEALNHLLIDAPIDITGKIVKSAIDIARLFLAEDVSVILKELEKRSIQEAVDYGMKFLLQNEIRVTPGAIEFKYNSQKGEKKVVTFQYIIIYQPLDEHSGRVKIRFYSPNPIEPPKAKQSIGGMVGISYDLQHDLPPFIVEITGQVEDFLHWTTQPSIEISFPESVPDLGIKPLSFWDKYLLKPIIAQIKEIEIVITKVTGISLGISDTISEIAETAVSLWDKVKSVFSEESPLTPAAIVQEGTVLQPQGQSLEAPPRTVLEAEPIPIPAPTPEPVLEEEEEQLPATGAAPPLEPAPEPEPGQAPAPAPEPIPNPAPQPPLGFPFFIGGGAPPEPETETATETETETPSTPTPTSTPSTPTSTPITAPFITSHNSGDNLGALADSATSTDGFQINLTGTSTPSFSILIFVNSTSTEPTCSTTTDSQGNWQQEITLQEGENTIRVKAQDQSNNQSPETILSLNVDIISPSAVTDLSASPGSNRGQINLTWTAPGDDASTNTTTEYIIRYATSSAVATSTWDLAIDIENEPTPSSASSTENLTVGNLTPGQTYFWALKSKDQAGNLSEISNCPSSTPAAQAETLVISEISAQGPNGAKDEFIELYNPTDSPINLAGWSLQYASAQATTTWNYKYFQVDGSPAKYLPDFNLANQTYYLLTSATSTNDYSYPTSPNLTAVTTNNSPAYLGLSADGGKVRLLDSQAEKVDLVAWGEDTLGAEAEPIGLDGFSWGSLERQATASSTAELLAINGSHHWLGNAQDTNDNSQDFVLQVQPNPQNSLSLSEPRSSFPGLAETDWPIFQHDLRRTGQSPYIVSAVSISTSTPTTTPKWTADFNDTAHSSPVIASDNTIYIGADNGHLYQVGADRELKLFYQTGRTEPVRTPTLASDSSIYISDYQFLYALSSDGELKWKRSFDFPVSLPVLSSEGVIYAGSKYYLYALNFNGEETWRSDELSVNAVLSPTISSDGVIYTVGERLRQRFLYALNPQNGSIIWTSEPGDYYASPSLSQDGLLFLGGYSSDGSYLYAFNSVSGLEEWRTKYKIGKIGGSIAAIYQDRIYVANDLGQVLAINKTNGDIEWYFSTGAGVSHFSLSPVVDNEGTIYIGSQSGIFYALNQDGTVQWQYNLASDSQVNSSAAIGSDEGGTIYISSYISSSEQGCFYAF